MAETSRMIDPQTGFIENPIYPNDFDAPRKLTFIEVYRQNGLKMHKSCAEVGVKFETVRKHLEIDQAFKTAFIKAQEEFYDDLEGISRVNATNPKSVIERIFQLKSRFPDKYGDNKRSESLNISINVDGKLLEMVKKREQIISEAVTLPEVVKSVDNQSERLLDMGTQQEK